MGLISDLFTQKWKIKDLSLSTGIAKIGIDRDTSTDIVVPAYRLGFSLAKVVWANENGPMRATLINHCRKFAEEIDLPTQLVDDVLPFLNVS